MLQVPSHVGYRGGRREGETRRDLPVFRVSSLGYATDRNRVSIPFLCRTPSAALRLPSATPSATPGSSSGSGGSSLFTLVASLPVRKPKPSLRSSSATTTTTTHYHYHRCRRQHQHQQHRQPHPIRHPATYPPALDITPLTPSAATTADTKTITNRFAAALGGGGATASGKGRGQREG